MKKFIVKLGTGFIFGSLLWFFSTEKSAQAHCKEFHPHQCDINHVRELSNRCNIINCSFMIVSDRNRNLYVKAINGAKHGSQIGLDRDCATNKYNLDCRWLSLDGRIVNAGNANLSIKAHKGAGHFAELRLDKDCNSDDLNCIWTWDSNGIIVSKKNTRFPVNAFNGARDGGLLKLHQECRASNPDCTWRKEYFD